MTLNIDNIIKKISDTVKSHRLENEGEHTRWLWQNDAKNRKLGIYASMVLTDSVDKDWENTYFNWLWENADPETGFWRKGCVLSGDVPIFHHLAGTFHYMFNHEYAHKPYRYPERIIDTCIRMYEENDLVDDFAHHMGFSEIDWVFCITRALRQCGYRFDDCKKVLTRFAKDLVEYLDGIDEKTDDGFNDLHGLFGTVCCLAELQQSVPGLIESKKPLKLVLDRRPFI